MKKLIALVGIIVVALLLWTVNTHNRPTAIVPVTREVATVPVKPMQMPTYAALPMPEVVPVVARPLSASVSALLPGVNTRMHDWRNHNPESQFVALDDKLSIPFERVNSYVQDERLIWIGRSAEEGSFYITAASADHMTAILSVPGLNTYEYTITNDNVTKREIVHELETCGAEAAHIAQVPLPVMPASTTLPDNVRGAQYTVDVAFFYDSAAASEAGGVDSLKSLILARIAAANTVLEQSNITNFTWNVLGVYPGPVYTNPNNTMETDLSQFSSSVDVSKTATEVGADQSVMLVGGTRNWAGLSQILGRYSVVVFNQTSYLTLTHELAHNFGALHDRVTENAADGNGRFAYGHTMDVTEVINGTNWQFRYGTVMSYFGNRIAYFSNPDVQYKGQPTGLVETDPKAANNARVLRDYAATISSYRNPPTAPSITSQPSSVTVNSGSSFTLTVRADGSNLKYQWYFENAAISGATSSSYSKTASSADQGNYYVAVSNSLGSVNSQTATVTVNTTTTSAPTPTTPATPTVSSGSGGGGGGGGAPSDWFLIAIALLCGARYLQKRNQREAVQN